MTQLRHLSVVLVAAAALLAGCGDAPVKSDAGAASQPKPAKADAPPPKRADDSKGTVTPAPAQRSDAAPSTDGMTIYELQDRLLALGYKLGAVDGVPGAKTIDALKAFQADNKLPVTGAVDVETIRRLRSAKPVAPDVKK